MRRSMRVIVALAMILIPAAARAQMLGVGPRFSLVRGDVATNTPSTGFLGGTVRLSLSGNLSLEGALDYRTTWNPDRTQRVREAPLQGSLLIYPIHGVLAPYALGGMGIYTVNYDVMGPNGAVSQTAQERKVGMHLGFGGEARLGKHAVAFLDYRYRFVQFGSDPSTTASGDAANDSMVSRLLGSVPGLSQLKVSHQGSMWTGGVAFVF